MAIADASRHRSLYFGLLEVVWTVAGGVGPVLGGMLTERLSWRWAFWVNLPICGSTFILLLLFLDVHNPKTAVVDGLKAVDWFGSISILAVTLMILLGLEFGGATFPWKSPQVLCLVIIGALLSGVFIFSEKRLARYPLMPLDLFKNSSNIASLLVCFLHGMVSPPAVLQVLSSA
jgi:MFS family permease